jgi:DNA-binding IclR family transcriptional regulator
MTGRKSTGGAGARAVRVLQCAAAMGPEFTVTELAKRVDLAPSTVHRLLQSLVGEQMIERFGADSYRPGPELFRMASLLLQRCDLRAIAQPVLAELSGRWKETCVLCVYDPTARAAVVMDTIPSAFPLRYVIEPGSTLSLSWGSLGRSILAFLPELDREEVLGRAEPGPLSGVRVLSPAQLRTELQAIRSNGYARYEDRQLLNVAGVAAPVFSANGSVAGSVGVVMPATRFKVNEFPTLRDEVLAAAHRVSAALGAPPDARAAVAESGGQLSEGSSASEGKGRPRAARSFPRSPDRIRREKHAGPAPSARR